MEKDIEKTVVEENFQEKIKKFFLGSNIRKILSCAVLVIIIFFIWQNYFGRKQQVQYQTAQVTRGTIISSVSESGSVAVSNRVSVNTQASGVVSEVDVKNGDSIKTGNKIAVISLDREGLQRQSQAWSSYLAAKSSFDAANATLYSLQSTMFAKWNTYVAKATNSTYQNPDGSPNSSSRVLTDFTTSQDDWFSAEALYKNQQGIIAQTQAALNSAWYAYQLASSIITAPQDGVIDDITIAPGMQIISANNSSTSTNTQSTVIGTVKGSGNPIVSITLSEIDATKVKSGQKATLTFDALPNQTFTGKVLGINTTGVVSSGVTTYPATIELDLPEDSLLPNMSATANIVTDIKQDALMVPTSAVQISSGQSTVRVLQNNVVTSIPVATGIVSDTDTEITSGLTEGEEVVVGVVANTTQTSGSSPFSSGLRIGGFGAGGFGGGTTTRSNRAGGQ